MKTEKVRESENDDEKWNPFIQEVAQFLKFDKSRSDADIVNCISGLLEYGIRNADDLIGVSKADDLFQRSLQHVEKLAPCKVPRVLADLLFDEYVAPTFIQGEISRRCIPEIRIWIIGLFVPLSTL